MREKETDQASLDQKTSGISGVFDRIIGSFKYICRKFSQKTRQLLHKSAGISAIIIIATLPIIIYGVSYLIHYTQKSEVTVSNFEIPYVIGKHIASAYNPGKLWSEQEESLYSIGAQTYNDEAYDTENEMKFRSAGVVKAVGVTTTSSIKGFFDFYTNFNTDGRASGSETFIDKADSVFVDRPPFENFVCNESKNSISYTKYVKRESSAPAYSFSKYEKDENLLKLSMTSAGTIKIVCPELHKSAEVTLPRNDIDIIIAIPTNRASNTTSNDNTDDFDDYTSKTTADKTPIKQIAKACQIFLAPFLHTAGVAVGIIPYSGKVTMSPYESDDRIIETPLNYNPTEGVTYAVQSMFYGSDGKSGGDVILHTWDDASLAYGEYLNWGSETYGRPIMARRGQQVLYRGMYLNSGAISEPEQTGKKSLLLDMTTSPTSEDNYKFMQMNINPCYLGFCNTLGMLCEKDCPTYRANPYFMKELTSDIQGLIYDLELFLPFKDERNKSNFLFLPIVMAGNLFSWGSHPSELSKTGRVPESARNAKTRVVVIIANAPDNFEPQEMTYLGFNNDYSEIPMIESDTILFDVNGGYAYSDGKYKGTKGIVSFESAYGGLDSTNGGYLFQENEAPEVTARISFPNKALVRVVTERVIPATIEVYDSNGVEDNVGTHTFWGGIKTLNFRGPQQVSDFVNLGTKFQEGNYTTKGPNFGHNLSTKKVKIKFFKCQLSKATLTNQILRFYGVYSNETGKDLIENTSGSVWSDTPSQIKALTDPCIDLSNKYGGSDSTDYGWFWHDVTDTYSDWEAKQVSFQGNCFTRTKWEQGSDGIYTANGKIDDCDTLSHYEEEKVTGIPYTNLSSGYFIASYDFNPTCYGISGLKKFVCAADRFQESDPDLITDTVKVKVGSTKKNLGDIDYDTAAYDTPMYRCYNTSSAGTTSDSYIQMLMGNFQFQEYNYRSTFGTAEKRSRTITQTVDTYRTFPKTKSGDPGSDYPDSPCCSEHWKSRCTRVKEVSKTCVNGNNCTRTSYDTTGKSYCSDYGTYDISYYECSRNTRCWHNCSYYPYTGQIQCGNKGSGWASNIEEKYFDKYSSNSSTDTGGGYNTDTSSCTGVCWQYYYKGTSLAWRSVLIAKGWSLSSTKSLDCNPTYTPQTKYRTVYTHNMILQSQDTSKCYYSEGEKDNCRCVYNDIDEPDTGVHFGYVKYNCSSSSCSSCSATEYGDDSGYSYEMNRNGLKWTETATSKEDLLAKYTRQPNGAFDEPQYVGCATGSSSCGDSVSEYLTYLPGLRKSSKATKEEAGTSIYRYNLYNFFFVSGDESKETEYTYNDGTLTSKISSSSDSDLLKNKGTYLLPTGEEDTYWVCFCGDADLQLDFDDATDSSVQFSNIDPLQKIVHLEHSQEFGTTSGVAVNYIEKKRIFYIYPDQIKDNVDDDGNYYVDLKITGKTRILSVEVTNRPLTSSVSSGTVEVLDADSSGGKLIGDTNGYAVFKLVSEKDFSFKASPVNFWIEGQSDFRQTSGTARVCGNSSEVPVVVNAAVPNAGSGKITMESAGSGVYKVYSDRKLQSIKVASSSSTASTSKVEFSGDVSSQSYTFGSGETEPKLFEWSADSMAHASTTISSTLARDVTLSGIQKNLNFNLTGCELVSAEINNMDMQFKPYGLDQLYNDFPEIRIYSKGDNDIEVDSFCIRAEDKHEEGKSLARVFITIEMPKAYDIYGSGTIEAQFTHLGSTGIDDSYKVGEGHFDWISYYNQGKEDSISSLISAKTKSSTGACNSSQKAMIDGYSQAREYKIKNSTNINITDIHYKVDNTYDLMSRISYTTQNTSKHIYEGSMPFNGVGDIKVYVQPKSVSTSSSSAYTKKLSDSYLTKDSFGNYVYTFKESRALSWDNDTLTQENNAYTLLYNDGEINGDVISQGSSVAYSVNTNASTGGYYYCDIEVSNVLLSVASSTISSAGSTTLSSDTTITVTPEDYEYEAKNGYYYVKVPCRNVYISDTSVKNISTLRYAHPNIISDELKNTRIIDGYDQATYQRMKLYGNMNYDGRSDLPKVSKIQDLYYNPKDGISAKYIYPQLEAGSAAAGEEGDFFIQLWDHNDETPVVRWKIGKSISSFTGDIIANSDFGTFKSNYAFSGLHRMFFPYDTYNKDYAGYSYAKNSAQVFIGYTLPINLILAGSGYQESFGLESKYISGYTKSNAALENLAKDACEKLKTDLKTSKGAPAVFLVKYRTSSKLSLDSCADYSYSADSEEDLMQVMRQISLFIVDNTGTNSLKINVSKNTE